MSEPTYHRDLQQGSPEWLALRCGMITASTMRLLLTPTGKAAENDKARAHLYELAAQRITGEIEPQYVSDAMLRGYADEIVAREIYREKIAPVAECGFVTRRVGRATVGYSPDGLVGDDGLIEIKSRAARYQVQTILADDVPAEYLPQLHTALLVTGRAWIDFVSYSAGLPLFVRRVEPDDQWRARIADAVSTAEARIEVMVGDFETASRGMIPTDRQEREMVI
jgi:predicted phage-related endonuclease